jgi:hypothetical protein
MLNSVKLSPSEPVRVADTQRPSSSQLILATCCAQGPKIASVTPPGFHALGASIHVVAVIARACPKCSLKIALYLSRMSAFMKSRFGSCMAIASTERELRLIHKACNSAKSSLMEMPLALTDHMRKESLVLCSKGSPLCSFREGHSGGGRAGGVPVFVVAGSGRIMAGSAATRESRKNVRQASFSRPGFMVGRGPRTLAEATDGAKIVVEDIDEQERALSTEESSSRGKKYLGGSLVVSNERREEDSLGWPIGNASS